LRNWIIPFLCLMLVTGSGCSGKKTKNSLPSDNAGNQLKPRRIAFESYDINQAPPGLRDAAEKNKTRETAGVYEEGGNFWVLLTRGQKPTGGYGVRITGVYLDEAEKGPARLRILYEYTDPAPGQFVTQVLSYPMELALLKDLKQKPANVSFVQQSER